MPPAKKPQVVEVPRAIAEEISDTARRTGRSVAFIVLRALHAGRAAPPAQVAGERVALTLGTDEDDPPQMLTKIKTAAGARGLDERLTSAWLTTRTRFLAWVASEERAGEAERADDLDTGLRDAALSTTSPERLAELAKSEYPRIRALVAVHPATPAVVLALLAADRERTVREAVEGRG